MRRKIGHGTDIFGGINMNEIERLEEKNLYVIAGLEFKPLDIEGFECYGVCREGLVVNFRTGKVLKGSDQHGHFRVNLQCNNVIRHEFVHRLVARAFVECPGAFEDFVVDHKNKCRTDNRASNLRWVSRAENTKRGQDAYNRNYKIVCEDTGEVFETKKELAEALGVGMYTINNYFGGMTKSLKGKQYKREFERLGDEFIDEA